MSSLRCVHVYVFHSSIENLLSLAEAIIRQCIYSVCMCVSIHSSGRRVNKSHKRKQRNILSRLSHTVLDVFVVITVVVVLYTNLVYL